MRDELFVLSPILCAFLMSAPSGAAGSSPRPAFPLDSVAGLELENVKAEAVTYRGRKAVRLTEAYAKPVADRDIGGYPLAILAGSDFADGTIEAEVAGMPRPGAPADARGFIGIAFRVQPHASRFECFYLRPTNGRSDDQLRRNHSTQYISRPGFPWERLRKEAPGVYESYVDLETGAWTKVRIVVAGTQARLYVHGAEQPVLIVNGLKQGESRGRIALWLGDDTEGYYSNLTWR